MINAVAKGTRRGRPRVIKRYKVNCGYCTEEIIRTEREIERYKIGYCSRKCYQKHKRLTSLGKNNTNWRGGISLVSRGSSGGGNKSYRKGRYYENKIRKIFEKKGFYVVRSAASKGIWDLVAINADFIVFVQSKANQIPGIKERERMQNFICPKNSIKQYWRAYGLGKWEINTWAENKWTKEWLLPKQKKKDEKGRFI